MPADRIDIRGLRPGSVELLSAIAAEHCCSISTLLKPRLETWLTAQIAARRESLPAGAVRKFEIAGGSAGRRKLRQGQLVTARPGSYGYRD